MMEGYVGFLSSSTLGGGTVAGRAASPRFSSPAAPSPIPPPPPPPLPLLTAVIHLSPGRGRLVGDVCRARGKFDKR